MDTGRRFHQHACLHEARARASLIEQVGEAREDGSQEDVEIRFDRRNLQHRDHSPQALHHVLQDLPRDPAHLPHDALHQLLHQRRVAEVDAAPRADLSEGSGSVLAGVRVHERGQDVLERRAEESRVLRETARVVLYDLEGGGDDELVLRDGAREDEAREQLSYPAQYRLSLRTPSQSHELPSDAGHSKQDPLHHLPALAAPLGKERTQDPQVVCLQADRAVLQSVLHSPPVHVEIFRISAVPVFTVRGIQGTSAAVLQLVMSARFPASITGWPTARRGRKKSAS
eukprot:745818-Hanusia_phi.AAC.3